MATFTFAPIASLATTNSSGVSATALADTAGTQEFALDTISWPSDFPSARITALDVVHTSYPELATDDTIAGVVYGLRQTGGGLTVAPVTTYPATDVAATPSLPTHADNGDEWISLFNSGWSFYITHGAYNKSGKSDGDYVTVDRYEITLTYVPAIAINPIADTLSSSANNVSLKIDNTLSVQSQALSVTNGAVTIESLTDIAVDVVAATPLVTTAQDLNIKVNIDQYVDLAPQALTAAAGFTGVRLDRQIFTGPDSIATTDGQVTLRIDYKLDPQPVATVMTGGELTFFADVDLYVTLQDQEVITLTPSSALDISRDKFIDAIPVALTVTEGWFDVEIIHPLAGLSVAAQLEMDDPVIELSKVAILAEALVHASTVTQPAGSDYRVVYSLSADSLQSSTSVDAMQLQAFKPRQPGVYKRKDVAFWRTVR